MSFDALVRVVITGLVYAGIVALLAGIVGANLYAIVHAWRSERVGWCVLLAVLFLTGGSVATAVYLFIHWDERLPRAASSPRRALA